MKEVSLIVFAVCIFVVAGAALWDWINPPDHYDEYEFCYNKATQQYYVMVERINEQATGQAFFGAVHDAPVSIFITSDSLSALHFFDSCNTVIAQRKEAERKKDSILDHIHDSWRKIK